MLNCLIVLLAVLMQALPRATVSGQVLDRSGNPVTGARITYKNVGKVDRNIADFGGIRVETPKMTAGTGRIYKVKTNGNGAFTLVGVDYGIYDIEITGPDGRRLYTGRKNIGDPADINAQNVLNVDLSTVTRGPLAPGGGTNLSGGKKTKAQLDLIREENAHADKINRLLGQYEAAVAIEDWLGATDVLKKLIAVDTNRWEFYYNLGRIETNLMQYDEAASNFARGVEVARKMLANPSDTDRALTHIGDLLMAEADCYDQMGKIEEAVALYEKAAQAFPRPFMAHYRACGVLALHGKTDAAVEVCNRAITDDPSQWLPYQALGGVLAEAGKTGDAIASYEKGIATARKTLEAKPDSGTAKAGLGQMLNAEGNQLVKLKQYDDAIAAFTAAAGVAAYPAMPYFNLCAIYYNLKRSEEAVAACDQAIASDPATSDAYYIKGAILFGEGRLEAGSYVVPPGTVEALNSYLQYAPKGQYAAAVKEMIDKIDEPIRYPGKPAKR